MNLHRRFIMQFFLQLLLLSAVFIVTIVAIWAVIGFSLTEQDAKQDLTKVESSYMTGNVSVQENKIVISEELKELAKQQNGWLLVVDLQGTVLESFRAPESVPAKFTVQELASWMLDVQPAGKERAYWKLDFFEEEPVYLFFEKENQAAALLETIDSRTDWSNGKLRLTPAVKREIKAANAAVQLIDSAGEVIDQYGAAGKAAVDSIEQIDHLAEEWPMSAISINEATETAVIVGVPQPPSSLLNERFMDRNFIYLFLLLLLPLFIGTFWYARKFGLPLLVMMQWIQNLGSREYEQPLDENKRPVLYSKKGKLKRKYRLYKDLIHTLEQLTETLKLHKTQRRELNRTREEWISGLSHDLKTPLSSISGYADLLKADNYQWSEGETKEFAGVISEKSAFMMELLEDLTLTFRLRNNALPLAKEPVELNEFMRRSVIQFVNDPANSHLDFDFVPCGKTIAAAVDPKWFQRIIDNLIANAAKYNPPGTMIRVALSTIENHLVIVRIEDNGAGMDTQTLNKLFERYYRGSHTDDSGTGSGLGMAITKQLVQLHGGSINVTSEKGQGTAVRLILPMD